MPDYPTRYIRVEDSVINWFGDIQFLIPALERTRRQFENAVRAFLYGFSIEVPQIFRNASVSAPKMASACLLKSSMFCA